MSYTQIQKIVKAGKGVLSYWLKDYPLSEEQKKKIYSNREVWVENFRETMKRKRDDRFQQVILEQKKMIGKIDKKNLFIAGVFLYWGEGQKRSSSASLSNTDPDVIKFYLLWIEECFGLKRTNSKVRIYLHLYSDMDFVESMVYWRDILKVNESQFAKPYIKKSTLAALDYKSFGHGTCRIQIANVKMKNQIMATIKLFSEFVDQNMKGT
jgi:hypothetical protein